MTLNRRELIALSTAATAAGLLGATPTFAADGEKHGADTLMNLAGADKGMVDRPIGNLDAPVTVIEYASPTCGHCGQFHTGVYPEFKEKYISSDQIQFILRPFVRNTLDAVVFMLAEAAGEEGYHAVVDTYLSTQGQWMSSDKPRDALLAVALQLGFTKESFEAALTNQDLFEGMELVREQALDEFDLSGTPTFYVNGKQLSGGQTLEGLSAEIDPLLG